ncbi:MAG: WXG100 family type VII secretion target [Hespellia sp.]|nr:WXG100 family type VII secretion target [Hespellia sp.]
MSELIEITTGNLNADRETMEQELQGIGEDLKVLLEEMQQLNATWEGAANQAYQAQVASDVENMQELCKCLLQYISCVSYAGTEYIKCEKSVASYIDSIRV